MTSRADGPLPTIDEIKDAQQLVYAVMPPTPQIVWPLLCERLGAEVDLGAITKVTTEVYRGFWASQTRLLAVQGNLQFVGEFGRIKRAAREIPAFHLERRHLAPTLVHSQDQLLRVGRIVDIDFAKLHATFPQKLLRAPTIA